MFPLASALSGDAVKVLASIVVPKGLMRFTTAPVLLLILKIVPPLPGSYRNPLARAAWYTGSQKRLDEPGANQSVLKVHTLTSVCPCQVYLFWCQSCVL